MPLYEYKCHKCGKEFEVLQKFSDAPLATHPGCGGVVEQLLSAPAFQFKGTGWYITDYARKNGSSSPKTEHSSSSKSESTSSKSAESKPSSAPESTSKS